MSSEGTGGVEVPGTYDTNAEGASSAVELLEFVENEETIRHFERRIGAAADFCADQWRRAELNNTFVSPTPGAQWDRADYAARTRDGRFAFTINDVALAVHALSGKEITGRYQRSYKGRDDEDHIVAEAINKLDARVRELALAEHVESDAFRTLAIEGYAWTEHYQDYLEDMRGQTRVLHHDLWNCIWDATARGQMLLDREWDAVGQWLSLDAFLAQFPHLRKEILQYLNGTPDGWVKENELGETARWPWLYRASRGKFYEPKRREVFLVDYQWRQREGFYAAEVPQWDSDPETGEEIPRINPRTGQQATKLTAMDEGEVEAFKEEQFNRTGQEPDVVGPEDGLYRWRYKRASILGKKSIRESDTKEGQFTRICWTGFPYRQREAVTFHGLVDYMKDPQRFKNNVVSLMISMLQRSLKGGIFYDPQGLERPAELADQMAQPYPMIATKNGAMMRGEKVWEPIPVSAFPSSLDSYIQIADMAVWRPSGMNPGTLGQISDFRRVSGTALGQASEAPSVVLGYLFNSLKIGRQLGGRLQLAIFRTRYDEDYLRELVGPKYADVIPPKEEWEEFFARDVIVDEEAATTKDQRMQSWELLSRQGTGEKFVQMNKMPMKLLAKLMPGLSEPERLEWEQWLGRRDELEEQQLELQLLQTQLQIMQTQQMMQPQEEAPPEGGEAPPEGGGEQPIQ